MRNSKEVIDIIKLKRKELNLSQRELARRINIPYSNISRYENYQREFPINDADKFAKALDINLSYLLGIKEQEHPSHSNTSNTVSKITENVEKMSTENKEKTLDFTEELLAEQDKVISIEEYTKVWVVEKASAGTGYSYGDNEGEFMYSDEELPAYDFATLIKGDSMEPKYNDGHVALVRQGYDGINGEVYLIDYNGESFIKKVYNDGDRFRLVSINRKYDDIKIYLDNLDEFTYFNIIGKVISTFEAKIVE